MSGETSDGAKVRTSRGVVLIQEMKSKYRHASSHASAAGQIEGLGLPFREVAMLVKQGQYLQM